MQRLTLSLDMKDDEVLDKAAQEVVEGAVKNKVRSFCENRVDDFVAKIARQKLEDMFKPGGSFLRATEPKIKEHVDQAISEHIKKVTISVDMQNDINEAIKAKILAKADEAIERALDTFDIKIYVDGVIEAMVKKYISGHVLDILLENMDKIDVSK